jgi:hypothetical protein
VIYPHFGGWQELETKREYEDFYPDLPARILDNIVNPRARISVVSWDQVYNQPSKLKWLIDETAAVARFNEYDLTRRMRRQNYTPTQIDPFRSVFK